MKKLALVFLGVVFFTVLTSGCSAESSRDKESGKTYADIEGLIMSQVQQFTEEGATLEKTAMVDGSEESQVYQPDSMGWVRELGFFRQVDMNKPAYRLAYDSVVNTANGRREVTYNARYPEEVPVQKLRVVFAGSEVRKLEAEFLERNELYSTFRRMEAEFDQAEVKGLPGRLNRYYLEGGHKIIFRDSITYQIEGRIR
ncbi:hypothetical protein AB9P05_07265 [Roseivirga sp. BDSF3-8]|uniref:hypothetical protein n=1 Tax=Roseivirga sp. BDSF3-8 TaxID=3241598 RepID=UPI003532636D